MHKLTGFDVNTLFYELRTSLGQLIVNRFDKTYKQHHINYDPDTCYQVADDILAIILAAAIPLLKSNEPT